MVHFYREIFVGKIICFFYGVKLVEAIGTMLGKTSLNIGNYSHFSIEHETGGEKKVSFRIFEHIGACRRSKRWFNNLFIYTL